MSLNGHLINYAESALKMNLEKITHYFPHASAQEAWNMFISSVYNNGSHAMKTRRLANMLQHILGKHFTASSASKS